jgi:catechol 2,3-dioxygenase-like lactoylglutathione lyase family enzyme
VVGTADVPAACGPGPSAQAALVAWRDALLEGLGYVWLEVEDLNRSLEFYRDGLRFAADTEASTDSVVHLRAGDLRLILSETGVAPQGCRGTGVAVAVEVTGVDTYHDALVARGLRPSRPRDDGNRRAFSVSDPDGYVWRFSQGP